MQVLRNGINSELSYHPHGRVVGIHHGGRVHQAVPQGLEPWKECLFVSILPQ